MGTERFSAIGELLLEKGELLFFAGLAGRVRDLVAGRVDGSLDGLDVQRLVGQDNGLTLCVRRRDLLDGRSLADGVVDVRFAHTAHHAVDFKRCLIHDADPPLLLMVAAARICAVRAARAAGAFSLFLLPDQIAHDCDDNDKQNG